MKTGLKSMATFAAVMRTELDAGIPPYRAVPAAFRTTGDRGLVGLTPKAEAILLHGGAISDALSLASYLLPEFVIPVVKTGEQSGRTVEAFRLLEEHCLRLAPVMRTARRAWLCPLVILAIGWALRLSVLLYFSRFPEAGLVAIEGGIVAIVVYSVMRQCMRCRFWLDAVRLQLPVVRETDIDISVCLYLRTFCLLYESGGIAVDQMAEYARATVPNLVIREELSRISTALRQAESFASAFRRTQYLQREYQDEIASAAGVGKLGDSLRTISRLAEVAMCHRLDLTNRFLWRVLAFNVGMAIVATLAMCL